MKSGTLSRCLTAAVASLSLVGYAEVKENPYQVIIERNAFGLKPPPPPPVQQTNAPVDVPPAMDVKLTGISTLLGPPKVFLQIQNQQTKKFEFPAALEVGEKLGDIEILAVDPEAGTVRIRSGDAETTLDFDKNGVKPNAVAGAVPPPQGMPGVVPLNVPPAPTSNPFNKTGSRVSVSGGTASSAPAAPGFGNANFGASIPARPMRSEGNVILAGGGQTAAQQAPQTPVVQSHNPEEVMRDIEARRQMLLQKEQAGQAPAGMSRILPPTRYTPNQPATPVPTPGQ
jgi:hypothetical protein